MSSLRAPRDSFVHLHVHTEYSMLDGAARIDELFAEAARMGMPALATTDHGYVFGAYEFWKKATEARRQADHRRRGLRHAGHPPHRPTRVKWGDGGPATTSPARAPTPT